MSYPTVFPVYYPQAVDAPPYPQPAGIDAHHYDGSGNPPVVSGFVLPFQTHAGYQQTFQPTFQSPIQSPIQPTIQPTAMISRGPPRCCKNYCGTPIPLAVNGNYNGPGGDEKSCVDFNVLGSPWCGIPVARVIGGDLMGLIGRDDLAQLNPNSGSTRVRVEWPGYKRFERKINMRNDTFKVEDLVRKLCAHIRNFIDNPGQPEVGSDPTLEQWIVGEGGIKIEKLVLVSLRRISVGCWVPCIRLINQSGV